MSGEQPQDPSSRAAPQTPAALSARGGIPGRSGDRNLADRARCTAEGEGNVRFLLKKGSGYGGVLILCFCIEFRDGVLQF